MPLEKTITVGLPNQGRLFGLSRLAAIRIGLHIEDMVDRKLYLDEPAWHARLVWLRGEDIPQRLAENAIQLGLVGNDYVMESAPGLVELYNLGWCPGRLSILVRLDQALRVPEDLKPGMNIYTQYPKVARRFLKQAGIIGVHVQPITGSAEALFHMPDLEPPCDATVDIVATGDTMEANSLHEAHVFIDTAACLYSNRSSYLLPAVDKLAKMLYDAAIQVTAETSAEVLRASAPESLNPPQQPPNPRGTTMPITKGS